MYRVVLGIEYDGTNYCGWQKQPNNCVPTIQLVLEQAISKIANHQITTTCAGRTDAKVHAMAQVVHFDTHVIRKLDAWILGVNRYLSPDIKVIWATILRDNFSARKSAIYRTYYYYIYNSNIKSALLNNKVTWINTFLNVDNMKQASSFLIGEHDFSSFRGRDCQSKTPFRNIHKIMISQQQQLIKISITANAFLQHMVRNIVGVLIDVGCNKYQSYRVQEILLAKNRQAASITAPPEGLYLAEVGYPKEYLLPKIIRGFSII